MADSTSPSDPPNGSPAPVNAAAPATSTAPTVDEKADKKHEHVAKDEPDKKQEKKKKGPAGGFDATPCPVREAGYDVRITFHRATNLPMADLNSLSSDPFLSAHFTTALPQRHKEDPPLRLRTKTIQRSTEPVWNATWDIAHVPASGFKLKVRIYDEDPLDHDDRLGNVHVVVPGLSESFPAIQERSYRIKKRMGSKRAYFIRACAALFNRNLELSGRLFVSVEVLGRSQGEGGRVYTLGPMYWSEHFSPLLGRIAGTKEGEQEDNTGEKQKKVQRYNFQANQIQLHGPVPKELYHRYVEFKPFIKGLYSKQGLRGRILNRALHHQHAQIYQYDRSTIYGCLDTVDERMTLQFLDMVHYDKGFRMFTYIISLDGLMRFTETGKEFGIDMLSKHSMHSDVDSYIAYSGEFFVRRHKSSKRSTKGSNPGSSPQSDRFEPQGESRPEIEREKSDEPPKDPSKYELVIDNDSGTYRPKFDLAPLLKRYLESQFPGLHISVGDCMDDHLQDQKKERRELKKKYGKGLTFVQASMSDTDSISSSDEEELDRRTSGVTSKGKKKYAKGVADMSQRKAAIKNLVHGGVDGAKEDDPAPSQAP